MTNVILITISLLASCKKKTEPTIETLDVTNLNSQNVRINIKLNNPSNFKVFHKGLIWNKVSSVLSNVDPLNYAFTTFETTNSNNFQSAIPNLEPNTTYYIKSYFVDQVGYHLGNEITITTPPSEPSPFNPGKIYGSVSDIEGNIYKTIQIGNQTWMAENLKVGKFNDGTLINELTLPLDFNNGSNPAWCYFNDSSYYDNPFGKLYNVNVVLSNKNVCPSGWHIPFSAEVSNLINNYSSNLGGVLKSTGYNFYSPVNKDATNESGFSSVGSGKRNIGAYEDIKLVQYLWTVEGNFGISGFNGDIYLNNFSEYADGYSIRCLKN